MRLTKRGTEIITQRGQGQRITVATNQPGKQPKRARAGRRRREITPTQACGCFHGGFTTQFRFFWCAIHRHMCNWVRSSSFSTTKAGTPATATSAAASGRGGNNSCRQDGRHGRGNGRDGGRAGARCCRGGVRGDGKGAGGDINGHGCGPVDRRNVPRPTPARVPCGRGADVPLLEGADVPCQAESFKPARGCGDRLPDTLGDLCRAASARLPSQVLARSKDRAELGTTTGRYRRSAASTNGTAGVWTVGS